MHKGIKEQSEFIQLKILLWGNAKTLNFIRLPEEDEDEATREVPGEDAVKATGEAPGDDEDAVEATGEAPGDDEDEPPGDEIPTGQSEIIKWISQNNNFKKSQNGKIFTILKHSFIFFQWHVPDDVGRTGGRNRIPGRTKGSPNTGRTTGPGEGGNSLNAGVGIRGRTRRGRWTGGGRTPSCPGRTTRWERGPGKTGRKPNKKV